MGMRMTQFVGLNKKSDAYLERYCEKEPATICPRCKEILTYKLKSHICGHAYGMFEEDIPLYEYTLKAGGRIREVVQAIPWSSGPVIFLCLKNKSGKLIYKWPQREIDIGSPLVEAWLTNGSILSKCFYKKGDEYRNPRLDIERLKQLNWHDKSKHGRWKEFVGFKYEAQL